MLRRFQDWLDDLSIDDPVRGIDGYSRLLEEEFATKLDGDAPTMSR